ncbi:MAG TPA: MFS transporter [Gemmatimonadales bacterium]
MIADPPSAPEAELPGRSLAHVRRFALGRAASVLGWQMVSVAVGWQLYERTGDPWSLGLVGLVELAPVIALLIPAGILVDRVPRRNVAMGAGLLFSLAALGLVVVGRPGVPLAFTYGMLLVVGAARAFQAPALASLLPELAPADRLTTVNAWIAATYEMAAIGGPALAGLLIAATGGATTVFALAAICTLGFVALMATLPSRRPTGSAVPHSAREIFAGFRFIRRTPVYLAAITLDLLAVLLGGAVALLPVYAKDILAVGPAGLGWLRTAPAAGALLMSLVVTRLPPWQRPGRVLLTVVAGFGLATIGFGVSRSFALSLMCLFLVGAFDAVSVVIRMTLEQVLTPDPLRGRVTAIHFLFIGFSNELGAFESGALAAWIGPVWAVAGGGIGTLLVVGAVIAVWPELAKLGPLNKLRPSTEH